MQIHIGVVEDRHDPLKLGRVRVRVFGIHTDDKSILPTTDLPWAMPMQGVNSAATSGVGMAPVGPVEGTWCVITFIDGEDMQQPLVLGTIGSASPEPAKTPAKNSQNKSENQPANSGLTTEDGSVVKDGSGNPINTESIPQPSGWTLGQTSKKYESGGKGPGTINAYAKSGDLGGASYGTYQFASYLPALMPSGKSRPSPKNSPILKFCSSSKFASMFAGLEPATAEFDAKWKECAQKFPKEFEEDQHRYIEENYYKVMIGKLKQAGLDLTPFGAGVQDLVWSTAVQFGPGKTSVFLTPLKGMTNLDDKTIIETVSNYKIENVDVFFKSSSQGIKDGVRSRYKSEKADLLKLASGYKSDVKKPITPDAKEVADNTKEAEKVSPKTDALPYSATEDKDNKKTLSDTATGYSDPNGEYPKKTYNQHPDTNRLATGKIEGTAAEKKTKMRALGMALPNGQSFDQPINTYHAKYPFNKVFESEAGHVIEVDDTPGAERINVWHKSGTFVEIDSVGNMVRRSTGSMYEIVDKNGYVYVQGKCNLSVGGSANIMVAADANIEVIGDTKVVCGNDTIVETAGRLQLSAGEAIDLRSKKIYIEADEELHIVGEDKINMQTKQLNARVNGDTHIQSDGKTDLKTGGDLNMETGAKASLKAAGQVAMDGSDYDWGTGAANAAGDAEGASKSKAGVIDQRRVYDEHVVKEDSPATRVDEMALTIETPEEASIAGPVFKEQLTQQGVVTRREIDTRPVYEARPVITPNLTTPKISIPGLGALNGILNGAGGVLGGIGSVGSTAGGILNGAGLGGVGNILTSGSALRTVSGALTRIRNLNLPVGDLSVMQKLLHAGLDVVRLNNIPPTMVASVDIGGIGISKAIKFPGLNSKLLKKIRNLHLTKKEVMLLKAIDLVNLKNMDLSSPEGVARTMRGMTAEIMQFGVYNPSFSKVTRVMRNLQYVPAKFRVSPNFAVKDLSFGTTLTKDRIVGQCGLKESEIAANLTGVATYVLEPIKKEFPEIQVISGFRQDNGMGYKSPHFTGNAVDIRLPNADRVATYNLAQKIRTMVPFDELGLESTTYTNGDWIHISYNSDGQNRGRVFTMHNHEKVADDLVLLF